MNAAADEKPLIVNTPTEADPTAERLQVNIDNAEDDHISRGMLGDRLSELNDPRGEGYVALGAIGFICCGFVTSSIAGFRWCVTASKNPKLWNAIDDQWWLLASGLKEVPKEDDFFPTYSAESYKLYPNRRALENRLALAFAELPPERKPEVIAAGVRRREEWEAKLAAKKAKEAAAVKAAAAGT